MKDRWVSDIQRGQFNCTLISDDNGATWKAGGTVPIGNFPDGEPNIIELTDGRLLFNSRVEDESYRVVSISLDGGSTWSVPKRYGALPAYMSTGSGLARLTRGDEDPTRTNRILFSFPNAPRRENMSVWLSYDEHRTWAVQKVVYAGPSYYSNLAILPDKSILLIYGRGGSHTYTPERTVVAHFNLEWLTDGRDGIATGPRAD
jgi:sialidase-1